MNFLTPVHFLLDHILNISIIQTKSSNPGCFINFSLFILSIAINVLTFTKLGYCSLISAGIFLPQKSHTFCSLCLEYLSSTAFNQDLCADVLVLKLSLPSLPKIFSTPSPLPKLFVSASCLFFSIVFIMT